MKLSKKIGILFIGVVLFTIIVYIASSQIMVDYLYEGERARITGITTGCIGRLDGKVNKVIGDAYEYKEVLTGVNKLNTKYGINTVEELGILKQFEKDDFDYNIILDTHFDVQYFVDEENKNKEDIELRDYLIEQLPVKKNITGIVSTSQDTYVVAMMSLTQDVEVDYVASQYFIGVSKFDERYTAAISGEAQKQVDIVRGLNPNINFEIETLSAEKQLLLHYTEDAIESYYLIPQLSGVGSLYLKVTEPLVVQMNTEQNMMRFTGILIVLCMIIYVILWKLIDKIIITRVNKLNEGINAINNSREIKDRLPHTEIEDEIGILTRDLNTMFDSLEEVQTENELKEKKYQTLLRSMNSAYATFKLSYDQNRNIEKIKCVECNEAMAKMFNTTMDDIYHNEGMKLVPHLFMPGHLKSILFDIQQTGNPYYAEQVQLTKEVWGQVSIFIIQEGHFTIIISDITTLKEYSDKMQYMANYDGLTGLRNRYSLYGYVKQLIKEQKEFCIYFMDLDNFKKLNDTIGHTEGDKVLCVVADKLKELIDTQTFVSRVGGDEFIIVRRCKGGSGEIARFGERIIKILNTQFEYIKYNFEIKASIGVSSYPYNGQTIETLLKYADIAMYESKSKGGNRLEIFSDRMLERIEIETKLKGAIEKQEFVAYYQPIYHLEKDEIVGAEALVRWIRGGEIILPKEFIDIAKQTGDILAIDCLMLEKACVFCKEWRMRGYKDFNVSVNMSFRSLSHPDIIEKIEENLNKAGLPADGIKIEIAEDEVIDRPKQIIDVLDHLRTKGIRISLDDFGIGYSSFNHIKLLPIDTLKIDRSLIVKLEEDEKTLYIIETLIELAHHLGIDVICEGIELKEQIEKLKAIGCDTIQGYYISQPVEPSLFEQYMDYYTGKTALKEVE